MSEIYPEKPGAPGACRTPDAVYHVSVSDDLVSATVELPFALGLGEDGAAALTISVHDALERALAPFFGISPAGPARYALVEQLGHRATTGTVREVTFLGKPALEVTDLRTGSVSLAAPDSLYGLTWLSEGEARARTRPWTAVALPAASAWAGGDDEDDELHPVCGDCGLRHFPACGGEPYDDEAERDDVLRQRREMAREAGDDSPGSDQ